jgi:hypothetical protein
MRLKQCSSNTNSSMYCAGRAAGFEKGRGDMLRSGDLQHLFCSQDKIGSEIGTTPGNHPGFSGKNIDTVATNDIGSFPGSGQTTKLFGADGYPVQ